MHSKKQMSLQRLTVKSLSFRVYPDALECVRGSSFSLGRYVNAEKSHLGADVEVVHSPSAHERQLHVSVRVDAARHHQFIGCIDHPRSRRGLKIQSNFNYFAVFNVDVADHGAVLIHNLTAFYQDPAVPCHCCSGVRSGRLLTSQSLCTLITGFCPSYGLINVKAQGSSSKVHMRYGGGLVRLLN